MRYWAVVFGLGLAACGAQAEHVGESGGEAGEPGEAGGTGSTAGTGGGTAGNVSMGKGGSSGKGGGAGSGGAAGLAGMAGDSGGAGTAGAGGAGSGGEGGSAGGGVGGAAGSAGSLAGMSGAAGMGAVGGESAGSAGLGGSDSGGQAGEAGRGGEAAAAGSEQGPYSLGCREEPPQGTSTSCLASRPFVWYCRAGLAEAACEPAPNGPEPPATLSCCQLQCVPDPLFDYGTEGNLACPSNKPKYRFCVGEADLGAAGCTPGGPSSSAGGWCCDA